MSRYPTTIHVTDEMAQKIDNPVDPAVISSRPGGGNTTQSYLKGDIIADALNEIFGPLGWGVEARIHQMDTWDETKSVQRNNQPRDIAMHMVQVISDVKLTIKKTSPDGTDTVFVQPGIGYGEAEEGKSRKEAFGMAVKGAATDGLKRCASLVGKAFGMMMASNGSQEDIEYAHNGRAQNLRKAQDLRRSGGRQQEQRDRGGRDDQRQQPDRGQRDDGGQRDGRGDGRRQDERAGGQRDEQRPSRDDAGRGGQDDRGQRRDERPEQGRGQQRDDRNQGGAPAHDEPRQQKDAQPERTQQDAPKDPASDKGAAAAPAGRRAPDTTYVLDHPPITKDDMTDFGASLVARVTELRQKSDRVGLVRQHLHTIKNLDAKIRRRVIELLKGLDVDVDTIAS